VARTATTKRNQTGQPSILIDLRGLSSGPERRSPDCRPGLQCLAIESSR
jgi:hypothetical protein